MVAAVSSFTASLLLISCYESNTAKLIDIIVTHHLVTLLIDVIRVVPIY